MLFKGSYKSIINADAKTAYIAMSGYIGGEGCTADMINDELANCTASGINTVKFKINSGGGDMFSGNTIINSIRQFNKTGKTIGINLGVAASMASAIKAACTESYAMKNAKEMIHEPICSFSGSVDEIDGFKNLASSFRDDLYDVYSAKMNLGKKDIADLMRKTTWYTAEQAKAAGLINDVIDDLDDFPAMPFEDEAGLEAVNTVLISNYKTIKVDNSMAEEKKETTVTVDNAAEIKALADKNTALELKVAKMEADAHNEKAVALVEKAIAERRITSGVKDNWVKLAVADFESTKSTLDSIAPAAKIGASIQTGSGGGSSAAAAAGRDAWDYDKWAEEDATGLRNMKANEPEKFEALKQALVDKVNATGKVEIR